MKANIFERVFEWLARNLKSQFKVLADGRVALFASIVMLWVANQHKNIEPREAGDSFLSMFFSVYYGYGSTMLMIWIMGLAMFVALIAKRDTFPYERAMLFVATIFMIASGVLVYAWGVQHNQSFF